MESRSHAPSLDALTEAEVEAIAKAAWRSACGLRAELGPEFVFSAIVGRSVAHFHQHLFARYQGTPRHPRAVLVDGQRRLAGREARGVDEVADLSARLALHLD